MSGQLADKEMKRKEMRKEEKRREEVLSDWETSLREKIANS